MNVPCKCEFRLVNTGKIRAFVNIHYGDFVIKDFKVMASNTPGGEPWVAMPSKQIKDREGEDRYIVTAWIADSERKKAFERFVLKAYYAELEKLNANTAS